MELLKKIAKFVSIFVLVVVSLIGMTFWIDDWDNTYNPHPTYNTRSPYASEYGR